LALLLYSWFAEFECHTIAFADSDVFFPILITQSQRRWQCPHSTGMILGIFSVGVDLAASPQLQPGLLRQLDDLRFRDVAAGFHFLCGSARLSPMFNHPQQSARLKGSVKLGKGVCCRVVTQPVMYVAESDDAVSAICWRYGALCSLPKLSY